MTLPDNLPTILTELQALPCWPKTHVYEKNQDLPFAEAWRFCTESEFFTPWLTSLAMHLLAYLDSISQNYTLENSHFAIWEDHGNHWRYSFDHNNTPQSIALAIIQAAHAVLVEEK